MGSGLRLWPHHRTPPPCIHAPDGARCNYWIEAPPALLFYFSARLSRLSDYDRQSATRKAAVPLGVKSFPLPTRDRSRKTVSAGPLRCAALSRPKKTRRERPGKSGCDHDDKSSTHEGKGTLRGTKCALNVRRQWRRCPEGKTLRNANRLTEELRNNQCER